MPHGGRATDASANIIRIQAAPWSDRVAELNRPHTDDALRWVQTWVPRNRRYNISNINVVGGHSLPPQHRLPAAARAWSPFSEKPLSPAGRVHGTRRLLLIPLPAATFRR